MAFYKVGNERTLLKEQKVGPPCLVTGHECQALLQTRRCSLEPTALMHEYSGPMTNKRTGSVSSGNIPIGARMHVRTLLPLSCLFLMPIVPRALDLELWRVSSAVSVVFSVAQGSRGWNSFACWVRGLGIGPGSLGYEY